MVDIEKFLKENSDNNYANFNKKLIFSRYKIVGVRIPILRKFSKEIEPEYIKLSSQITHEEILLYGLSASKINSEEKQLEYMSNILPYIDNWCTCDIIVCSMKKLKGEKSYNFFTKLLKSENEFYVRVGIIGLMRFFMETAHINQIVENLKTISNSCDNINKNDYYIKMAISWFYAELAIKDFPLAKNTIASISNKFIRNKAISKAQESFRITSKQKQELKKLRI